MNQLLQRILEGRFRVVFSTLQPNVIGLSEPPNLITIDLKAISPVKVYIHECLHLLEPEWCESEVLRQERALWKKLTRYERFVLYRKLFARKYRVRDNND